MPRPAQDGLLWEEKIFGLEPRWTREPVLEAIENVCRQQLNIPSGDPCTITFHASGAFNKIYTVKWSGELLIMRITLPVYPRHKTLGEVTTLRWVSKNTKVPVPKVLAFDDSNDNEIGFEWILLNFVDGTPAYSKWRKMSMEQKVAFTKQIAEFQAELSGYGQPNSTFKAIGTLHMGDTGTGNESKADLQSARPLQLVSHQFFMGNHLHRDVARGPFYSSYDWLSAHLKIILLEQTARLEKTDDEDDRDDQEESLDAANKLLKLLPTIFPSSAEFTEPPGLHHVFPFMRGDVEPTGLYHHDLHLNNIFVDEGGAVTAIIDWESVSALPLWYTTLVPKFLDEVYRQNEPRRETYADEDPEDVALALKDPDSLDNEGKNILYWEHQMQYEATQLQKVYKARLKELWPEWPLEGSVMKVEFYRALEQADGLFKKMAGKWADRVAKGETLRFHDMWPTVEMAA